MDSSIRPLFGWLAAFAVLFVWAGWVVVSRFGVGGELTPYDIVALRFSVAAVAVAPFLRRHWPRHIKLYQVVIMASASGAPFLLLAFSGMRFAPAAHAGVLMNGALPVFAALLGWLWLGQRPRVAAVAGLAVILIGCTMIAWDRSSGGVGEDAWIGQLLFVASALTLATYMVAAQAWAMAPLQAMAAFPFVNLIWFGPLYLIALPKGIGTAGWPEILLQGLYQGLGPSILGILLFTTAIRSIGAAPTATVMALVPGMAAVLAIPVLGEWPSLLAWAGLALVTTGILLSAARSGG